MSASRRAFNQRTILGDASFAANTTRSSSRSSSRRKSFSVSDRSDNATPLKMDRRAMLEEWRKQARGGDSQNNQNHHHHHASGLPMPASSADVDSKKRSRMQDGPPLPPSGSSSSNLFVAGSEGLSTRDRIRQRKQQRRHVDESPAAASTPSVPMKSSIEYFDEDDVVNTGRSMTASSPLLRKSMGGARRRTLSASARRGRGTQLMSLSQESEGEFSSLLYRLISFEMKMIFDRHSSVHLHKMHQLFCVSHHQIRKTATILREERRILTIRWMTCLMTKLQQWRRKLVFAPA